MWLGPIDPAMFLSVVDDLIWFLMDGNLDGGYPLIGRCAPATDYEMSAIRRTLWQRPLNLLSVRQREIVAAAEQLGPAQATTYQQRQNCPIALALQSGRIRGVEQLAGLIAQQPFPYPDSLLLHSLGLLDSVG